MSPPCTDPEPLPRSTVQLIRRGPRHQGYGFVTFATAEDAATAIAKYNDTEVAGRNLVIEALKHTATESSHNRKANKSKVKDGSSSSPASAAEDGPSSAAEKDKSDKPKANGRKLSQKKKTKKPAAPTADKADKTDKEKERVKKGEPTGPPSQTLVFVANLAYSVEQPELKAFFEEGTGLSVKGLYIARAVVRRARKLTDSEKEAAEAAAEADPDAPAPSGKKMVGERRSRGYAFVDFATHEQQQQAIEQFNDKEFHGRNLVLKVALENEERKKKSEEIQAKKKAKEAKENVTKTPAKEDKENEAPVEAKA